MSVAAIIRISVFAFVFGIVPMLNWRWFALNVLEWDSFLVMIIALPLFVVGFFGSNLLYEKITGDTSFRDNI